MSATTPLQIYVSSEVEIDSTIEAETRTILSIVRNLRDRMSVLEEDLLRYQHIEAPMA